MKIKDYNMLLSFYLYLWDNLYFQNDFYFQDNFYLQDNKSFLISNLILIWILKKRISLIETLFFQVIELLHYKYRSQSMRIRGGGTENQWGNKQSKTEHKHRKKYTQIGGEEDQRGKQRRKPRKKPVKNNP